MAYLALKVRVRKSFNETPNWALSKLNINKNASRLGVSLKEKLNPSGEH